MDVTESDLESIVGTEQYRCSAIREALEEGKAAYGPINLKVREKVEMLEVEGPFFKKVFDLRQVEQTEIGPSVVSLRELIDEVISEETEDHIMECFW